MSVGIGQSPLSMPSKESVGSHQPGVQQTALEPLPGLPSPLGLCSLSLGPHLLQQSGRSLEAITDAQGRNPPACVTLAKDSTALSLSLLIC